MDPPLARPPPEAAGPVPAAALPPWLHSRRVPWFVGLVALLIVGAAASFVLYEKGQLEQAAFARLDLYARVLEDHANRTLDSAELALQALARTIVSQRPGVDPERHAELLGDALIGQPHLRSISLLDARGRVMASSNSENHDRVLPLTGFARDGALPHGLGPLLRGRDISALDSGGTSDPAMMPMLRPLPERGLVLAAMLNVGYFANQYALLLGREPVAASILGHDGHLIAATDAVAAEPGSRQASHPVFRDFLPAQESGRFVGPGLDGTEAFGSFRSARRYPLVLLAETPRSTVQAELADLIARSASVVAAMLLLTGGLGLLAWRSLRGHEAARSALLEARGAVAAQHAFTDRLFEVSPVPMVVRGVDGRYHRVNRAWCDFTGFGAERVRARTLGEAGIPAPRAQHDDEREREAIASGRLVVYENRLPDADGTLRDVIVRVMPFFEPGGAVGGVITSLLDITEFRTAERRTEEARAAAERANDAKSEFIANISHELRTPLQAILGFSELGLRRSALQPALHGMFDDIAKSGRRMLVLVNNLLDLSRLDSTVGSVRLRIGDIEPALREVVRELQPLAEERSLTIGVPATPVALVAEADPDRMGQVLRNVLANAVRYAPPASRIEVDWSHAPAIGCRITVSDRGPGIPPDELDIVFEPFVQSSRTKDGSGGTGLGLAICRKILAAHRGAIRARNREGGGAEFEIRLPPVA